MEIKVIYEQQKQKQMIPARGPQTVLLAIFNNLGHLVAARVEVLGLISPGYRRSRETEGKLG